MYLIVFDIKCDLTKHWLTFSRTITKIQLSLSITSYCIYATLNHILPSSISTTVHTVMTLWWNVFVWIVSKPKRNGSGDTVGVNPGHWLIKLCTLNKEVILLRHTFPECSSFSKVSLGYRQRCVCTHFSWRTFQWLTVNSNSSHIHNTFVLLVTTNRLDWNWCVIKSLWICLPSSFSCNAKCEQFGYVTLFWAGSGFESMQ